MNICEKIACPFANLHPTPPRSSGCERYSVSNHCHLMASYPQFRTNQYWLFDELSEAKIAEVKKTNDEYIAGDESSQFRLVSMNDE